MLRQLTLKYKKSPHIFIRLLVLIAIVLLGILLGYLSEWLEYGIYHSEHPILNYQNTFCIFLGRLLNHLSVWIFLATLIAYFSWGPVSAGFHTLSFFLAMCTAYFIPKHIHYGYAVHYQFLFWTGAAVISSFAAILIWYSKVGSIYGTIVKSLPVSAILAEGTYIIIFNRIRYYRPTSPSPALLIKWLLSPEWALMLTAYMAFIVILIFCLFKKRKKIR